MFEMKVQDELEGVSVGAWQRTGGGECLDAPTGQPAGGQAAGGGGVGVGVGGEVSVPSLFSLFYFFNCFVSIL